jgi:hypothetical protein
VEFKFEQLGIKVNTETLELADCNDALVDRATLRTVGIDDHIITAGIKTGELTAFKTGANGKQKMWMSAVLRYLKILRERAAQK